MVPTASSPRHSPKRSPKRQVLHEQSQSQTNKILRRLGPAEGKQDQPFSTPYPTKPSHVLLPSSIRSENGGSIQKAPFPKKVAKGKESIIGPQDALPAFATTTTTIPNAENPLGTKRSVSELRDLYESQATPQPLAIHSTRPSSRPPAIVSSPALQGQYLGEKLSEQGRFIPSESDEDPSPLQRDASFSIKKIASESSLSPPHVPPPDTPSPKESPVEDSSSAPEAFALTSSSPNLIVLGSSSSVPVAPSVDPSSPNFVPLGHSSSQEFDSEPYLSSPNIAPLRLSRTSAPNSISLSNSNVLRQEESSSLSSDPAVIPSSPIFLPIGTSTPSYPYTNDDDSSDGSPDSVGTVKRHRDHIVHEQPSTSTFSSGSEQFNSSPPNRGRSIVSLSNFDLQLPSEGRSTFFNLPQSDSFPASEDDQTARKSSPAPEIEYPVVSAPTLNTWEALNVHKRAPRLPYGDHPSIRWNPHLSTVPSEWSQENQLGSFNTIDTEELSDAPSIPQLCPPACTHKQYATNPLTSSISDVHQREATDMISDLRAPDLHRKNSGLFSIFSGSSRTNSMRSIVLRRPNSNDSLSTTVRFPGWVRRYYSRGRGDPFQFLHPDTSSSALSYQSRPPTAVPFPVQPTPRKLPLPPVRGGKNPRESHLLPGIGPLVSNPSQGRPSSLAVHPADPRAHWAGAEQAAIEAELRDGHAVETSMCDPWSPHLFPNSRAGGRPYWLAPALDDNRAPIFTWRDAHMLAFILGFIFPITWFVAALLPLPPKPITVELSHDAEAGGPTSLQQLDHQTALRDEIRYLNLRWWRNLNRFMCIVGLVIIAVIITLAVIGTRGGLSAS